MDLCANLPALFSFLFSPGWLITMFCTHSETLVDSLPVIHLCFKIWGAEILPVGMLNGTDALENKLAVPYEGPAFSRLKRYLRSENLSLCKDLSNGAPHGPPPGLRTRAVKHPCQSES